jgi:hypothetical protein
VTLNRVTLNRGTADQRADPLPEAQQQLTGKHKQPALPGVAQAVEQGFKCSVEMAESTETGMTAGA